MFFPDWRLCLLFKCTEAKDMEPPVLSADAEKFSASIKADEKKLISGVTAFDQKDGDVSDSILIDSIKRRKARTVIS